MTGRRTGVVRVGPYAIVDRIASGGMGTVYLGEQQGPHGFKREVAIKMTHRHLADQPRFAGELVEEAKLAARIRHPNVVQVLDVGEEKGTVYLVLEYIDGASLSELLKWSIGAESPPLDAEALRVLVDALSGLHAAHELKDDEGGPLHLIHRDFSPQNILVGRDGIARLTDFGVAKAASRVGHTTAGVVKGKTAYLAPEQLRGGALDRRADVWAAGVVAWEVFARRRLFPADSEAELLLKIVAERPRRLRTVRPDLPESLDEAVARALEPEVDERFENADAFRAALVEACRGHFEVGDRAAVTRWVVGACEGRAERRRAARISVPEVRDEETVTTPERRLLGTPSAAHALGGTFEGVSTPAPRGRASMSIRSGGAVLGVAAVLTTGYFALRPTSETLAERDSTVGAELGGSARVTSSLTNETMKPSLVSEASSTGTHPSAAPPTTASAAPKPTSFVPKALPTQTVRPRKLPPNPYAK